MKNVSLPDLILSPLDVWREVQLPLVQVKEENLSHRDHCRQ